MTTRFEHAPEAIYEIPVKKFYKKQVDGSFELADVPADGLSPEQFDEAIAIGAKAFADRPYDALGIVSDHASRQQQEDIQLAIRASEKAANSPEGKAFLAEGRAAGDLTATSESDLDITPRGFHERAQALANLIQREFPGRCLSLSAARGAEHWIHIWNSPVPDPLSLPYTSGHISAIEAMIKVELNERARMDMFAKALADQQAKTDAAMAEGRRQYAFKSNGADDVESLKAQLEELKALIASPATVATSEQPAPAPAVTALPGDPADYGLEPTDASLVAEGKARQASWIEKLRGK